MKSSIRVSNRSRSITFKGDAARKAFEAMTGTTLPANTNAAPGPEMQVISHKLCSLQVCVPESTTDATVETFANQARPTGIESKWKIRSQGDPALAGCDERVKCTGRAGCVHVMLDC